MNRGFLMLLSLVIVAGSALTAGPAPTDNPVATYYGPEQGYPAWTERIRWDNVIDMSTHTKGWTNFEKSESARDELAAKGVMDVNNVGVCWVYLDAGTIYMGQAVPAATQAGRSG